MYIWQGNASRLSELAKRFQEDTNKANVFKAERTHSSLNVFAGEDAVTYFQVQFAHDLRQAMVFGGVLMSSQVFVPVDSGSETFDKSNRE